MHRHCNAGKKYCYLVSRVAHQPIFPWWNAANAQYFWHCHICLLGDGYREGGYKGLKNLDTHCWLAAGKKSCCRKCTIKCGSQPWWASTWCNMLCHAMVIRWWKGYSECRSPLWPSTSILYLIVCVCVYPTELTCAFGIGYYDKLKIIIALVGTGTWK